MYCGEGDFAECCKSIVDQVGVQVTHKVIADLPEKEAHNQLWQSWRDAKSTHDMFVKIDADTVLTHNQVLAEFWQMMQANPRITGIQAPLLDYFTDGYINGLNCFSPKVTFRDSADELFCDRQVDVDHDIVVKANGVSERLRPPGWHCYHATDAQAFHFGLHRALKGQKQVLELVRLAQVRHGDRLRKLALAGAACSIDFAMRNGFNYSDERFCLALDAAIKRVL